MTTKTKNKPIVLFDPGSIELEITGSIKKNTLPAVREAWTNWLARLDANTLDTDQDFADAAKFVTDCKRVEERLDGIREDALKGKVFEAIKEIEAMKETTRQKRLEFDHAVTTRKDRIKTEAVTGAVAKVNAHINTLKYRWTAMDNVDVDGRIRTAIKGKSAILKMNEALEAEVQNLITEATAYSYKFEENRRKVGELYTAAGETATDSELDMMVRTYGDGSAERAKFILDQKKMARDQAELDRKKKELEKPAGLGEALPCAANLPPTPAPAGPAAKIVRFGADFKTDNIEATTRLIESIGGSDVKFIIK